MREFNIGDRVVSLQNQKQGIIEDKLFSNKLNDWVYTIHFNGSFFPSTTAYSGANLELVVEDKSYRWEVFQADNNVVTAVMYESVNGVEREVDRKHGHCIHAGAIGFAQAASYAMKKIYTNMNDGQFIGTEDN